MGNDALLDLNMAGVKWELSENTEKQNIKKGGSPFRVFRRFSFYAFFLCLLKISVRASAALSSAVFIAWVYILPVVDTSA